MPSPRWIYETSATAADTASSVTAHSSAVPAATPAPTAGSVWKPAFRDARVPSRNVALAIGFTAQECPNVVLHSSPQGAPLHGTNGRRPRRQPQCNTRL